MLIITETSSILFHLYTPQMFGLSFDYMLQAPIPYKNFMKLKETYIDDFLFAHIENQSDPVQRTYFIDDRSTRDVSELQYYPGILMVLEGPLDKFLPLRKGAFPEEKKVEDIGERAYELRYVLSTRRLEHDFQLYTMQDPIVKKEDSLRTKTYVEYGIDRRNASQLQGFCESLINNGYVAFFRAKQRPLTPYWYKEFPTTFLRLRDINKAKQFEAELTKNNISYLRYDRILEMMQTNNNTLQSRLFAIMITIFTLALIVGSIMYYANINSDIESKQREHHTMYMFGYNKASLKKQIILYELLILIGGTITGSLLYYVLRIPYYTFLNTRLGIYEQPPYIPYMRILLFAISIISILIVCFISRYKRKEPHI